MTTETYSAPPVYTVMGTGPYAIPHEYHAAEEIAVQVFTGTVTTELIQDAEYTIAPAADAISGTVTLTAVAAALHAGSSLRIQRRTVIEQGYAAQGGEREGGLEVQLDRQVRGIQDATRRISDLESGLTRALRVPDGDDPIAAWPTAAARANHLMAWDEAGAVQVYTGAVSLTVGEGGPPYFAHAIAAGLASVADAADAIILLGQFAAGDGGGGVFVRVESEPSHLAKLQTADGQWWETVEDEPSPMAFGARWDGSTDDTVAINAWAAYLRSTSKAGRMPPGTTYCAGTLYLGGARIRGAGGPTLESVFASKTVISSNGNPMISMAPSSTIAQTFFLTHWEHFTVVSAGGAFSPIELWDRLSYPYRVGVWLGRNHNFMQRTTDTTPEAPTAGGSGGLTMRNVNVQDASGWGIYAYKLWGKSLINDCFFRRCGGEAAVALADDRLGGAMNFAGLCVNFHVSDVHAFHEGYTDPALDGRGCGLRIGAIKSDTDAAGLDRLWDVGGDQKFDAILLERTALPICIEATLSATLDGITISGARDAALLNEVRIGHDANPANNCKVMFGRWRSFDLKTIHVQQAASIDLGAYLNQDQATTTAIKYSVPFLIREVARQYDTTESYAAPTVLSPQASPSIGTRPRWQFVPNCTGFGSTTIWSNRLNRFGAGAGQPLENWVGDGAGTVSLADDWRLGLFGGEQVYHQVDALTAGDVATVQLWIDTLNATTMQNVEFGALDSSGADLIRIPLGYGAKTKDAHWRALNVTVPGDGIIRPFFKVSGTNVCHLKHPLCQPGAAPAAGRHPLSVWPTPLGIIFCA
jgi:hypothetical protein